MATPAAPHPRYGCPSAVWLAVLGVVQLVQQDRTSRRISKLINWLNLQILGSYTKRHFLKIVALLCVDAQPTCPASLNWPALQVAFADHPEFTRAEVLAFYHHADLSLNPNTLDSRIRQLLQRRPLLTVGRKHYIVAANAAPRPPP